MLGLKGDKNLIQKLSDRFDQLHSEIPAIESTIRRHHSELGDYDVMDDELALTWKVKEKKCIGLSLWKRISTLPRVYSG